MSRMPPQVLVFFCGPEFGILYNNILPRWTCVLRSGKPRLFLLSTRTLTCPPAPLFPIPGLPVFQTPNATLIHTSASAGESVPVGWYDRQESEPTEACFGIFDEPIQSAEVASLGEEAKESQVS